ncbi:SMC family ATPase [Candidatus Woesearchaeota archaeon]|nr:SMC family ATPase [Candidatus Woesearchaeota archaeon]
MLIKSVRLHNIRSYLSQGVEFPEGSLLLSGDIGSGKSTILLAIEFALFGISKGLLSGEALLRHGKQQGYVELEFNLDGKDVVIKRNLKRLKDSVRQEEGYLVVDNIKQFCTAEELRARVLAMLGYPKELLKKSKGLIYRFTVYTPQEEMKRILFEDPQARLDTLRRVFQIDRYRLVKEGSGVVLQALREKKKELAAKTEDLPQKEEQLRQLSGQLETVEKKLAALQPVVGQTEKLLQQRQESLRALEEKARLLNSLKSQLAAALAVISEKNSRMALQEAEISLAKREVSSFRLQLQDSSAHVERLSSSLSRLKAFSDSLLKDVAAKTLLDDELLSAEQLKSDAESQISRLDALKSASEMVKQKVSELAKCPTCFQPVAAEHKHKIALEENSKINEISPKLADALERKNQLSQEIASLKRELNGLQAKEKLAAGLASELKPYFELAAAFSATVKTSETASLSVAEMQAELASLSAARKQLEAAKEKRFMSAEKERFIRQVEAGLDAFRKEAQLLEAKKAELSARAASFGNVEADIGVLQAELDNVVKEKTALLMQKASLEKEKENFSGLARLLLEELQKKKAAMREMEESNKLAYWLEEMFVSMVAVIEKHVMAKVHQEFNGLFREWFAMLMGTEAMAAKIDDEFTPVVEVDGFEIPVENLSGGEKTSCALAYRLALNKVINNLVSTIRTKDLLILDEPTDGFSTEQLDKLRDVLSQLQLPQVIIVSHEERVESFVQHVIRIEKEQHVSRLVV